MKLNQYTNEILCKPIFIHINHFITTVFKLQPEVIAGYFIYNNL